MVAGAASSSRAAGLGRRKTASPMTTASRTEPQVMTTLDLVTHGCAARRMPGFDLLGAPACRRGCRVHPRGRCMEYAERPLSRRVCARRTAYERSDASSRARRSHTSAVVEILVPVQAEGLAVELGAADIRSAALEALVRARRDAELDVARDAVELQPSEHDEAIAVRFDGGALELGAWEALHVEQLGRAEVLIALRGVSVDARQVDPYLDARAPRRRAIDEDRPAPTPEAAVDLRDHEVPQDEGEGRAIRVDLPALEIAV